MSVIYGAKKCQNIEVNAFRK